MTNDQRPGHDDCLEPPLDAAVQAVLAAPLPADAVARVILRAKQLAAPAETAASPAPRIAKRPSKTARVVLGILALAAALLAAVGLPQLLDQSAGRAFAQVIEQVKAAASVQLTMSTRIGKQPAIDGQMFLEGSRMRIEQFHGTIVQVADLDRKRALLLDVHRKLAQTMDIDAQAAREFDNPIDQLRRAKSDEAESLGEQSLGGRRTHVYRLRKVNLLGMRGEAEMLVWVDAQSKLPAKIVIHDPDPKAEMEIRFDEFAWNRPLAAGLFSLDVPAGFQAGVVAKAPRAPQPAPADATALNSPNVAADGILSRDRVPARIVWNPPGTAITALVRDPESVPPLESRPHELRQWDVATGKCRWTEVVGGAGWLAATADGTTLATVIGYEVQLRDAATGQVARKWATDRRLLPLAFSPDGKTLAAGINEWGPGGKEQAGGVQFWDVERASLVRTIADDKPIAFIGFSGDGKRLASASNDGPVKLWDATTGELVRIFPGCLRAAFSPDGESIACPSTDTTGDKNVGRVDLFHLQTGELVKSLVSEKAATSSYVLWVTFSPAGRLLAATDWNGTVTLWDLATGQRLPTTIEHHAGVHTAEFAPDGGTLATGSEDLTLRLWKVPAAGAARPRHKK